METDVLVIGSGPAGIQAAIHASRRKVSVTVAGRPSASAAAGTEMDNYFGTGHVSGDRRRARRWTTTSAPGMCPETVS